MNRYPDLLGQIFFPTDSARLDRHDQQLLGQLAREFQVIVLGRRLEFSFVGNADHRGSAAYNLRLARRRAEAVKDFMDPRFGGAAYYS